MTRFYVSDIFISGGVDTELSRDKTKKKKKKI